MEGAERVEIEEAGLKNPPLHWERKAAKAGLRSFACRQAGRQYKGEEKRRV